MGRVKWKLHLADTNLAENLDLKTPKEIWATIFDFSLNYIKQNRLKDTFHWTPLFSKEKFHMHEYDVPLDRVGHC